MLKTNRKTVASLIQLFRTQFLREIVMKTTVSGKISEKGNYNT